MDRKSLALIENIKSALAEKNNEADILKTAVKIIDAYSDGFSWTGIYMLRDGILEVNHYVGPPTPHTKIELGRGICGASAQQKKSIIVDDVNADPRFLACSITTKSEIVVPLMNGNICLGEIDIDSNQLSFFTEDNRIMLEAIADIIVKQLIESK